MPFVLQLALMVVLVVVLALVAGPRHSWNGGSVGWIPFAIMFGVAGVAFWLIDRLKGAGEAPPGPPEQPSKRPRADFLIAGIAVAIIVLALLRAYGTL